MNRHLEVWVSSKSLYALSLSWYQMAGVLNNLRRLESHKRKVVLLVPPIKL